MNRGGHPNILARWWRIAEANKDLLSQGSNSSMREVEVINAWVNICRPDVGRTGGVLIALGDVMPTSEAGESVWNVSDIAAPGEVVVVITTAKQADHKRQWGQSKPA